MIGHSVSDCPQTLNPRTDFLLQHLSLSTMLADESDIKPTRWQTCQHRTLRVGQLACKLALSTVLPSTCISQNNRASPFCGTTARPEPFLAHSPERQSGPRAQS
eukprot:GHUV01056217.1.p1 GENE.GHUV01056217.1~~GHUV01056217.1.p1  ORF type:complete len:104 (+),score=11.53 GHUV01056217.1:99-410(+)